VEPQQLRLVFADSPEGSGNEASFGEPEGKAFLQQIASARKMRGFTAAVTMVSLEAVSSPENLAAALLHVARNKGACGVDGVSVGEVVQAVRDVLPRLRKELLSGRYAPGDIRRVWIPKPGGGQRGLGIPNVVDRWVQQAVHQVMAPVFEPNFHDSSHGFRPKRGAGTAIAEAKGHVSAGQTSIVSIDLSKFFDRVNHQRLLTRMSQRIEDGRLLRLVGQMLKARVVLPDGTRVATEEGTPQGGPLSPLLSNIVLDELDWEMERRGLRFVRYADDFNVFVRSERAARRVMESLTRFIERRLRLKVNTDKSAVTRPQEVHFLGFSLHRQADGTVEVHLSQRSRQRLDTKIREITPRNWGRSLEDCIEGVNSYLRGWSGYYRLCTREGAELFRRYDAHIRRRVRAIIVCQKKRPRYLYRHLISRGVSRRTAARTAWCDRGRWHKSNRPGMTSAYRNAWFHERMVSMWTKWLEAHPPATALGQLMLPGFEIPT
jgi:group II intron reverse transcriptase/maturase